MKQLKELKKQREELDKNIKELEEKDDWLEVPEEGIKIKTKQSFNNKTYAEILEEVKESEIAGYPLLQKLRNRFFDGEKQFKFLEDFWVLVPNLDKISKKNNYVARFDADSGYAALGCGWDPSYRYSDLGVFLIKPLEVKK